MKHKMFYVALTVSAVLTFGGSIVADVVKMKDGRELSGRIVEEDDKTVVLEIKGKFNVPLKKADIEQITREKTEYDLRDEKLEALNPANPSGYLELAEAFLTEGKFMEEAERLANIANVLDKELKEETTGLLQKIQQARYLLATSSLLSGLAALEKQKFSEAARLLKLGRSAPVAGEAREFLRQTVEDLVAYCAAKEPCKVCKNTGMVQCLMCKGKGTFRCPECQGSGKRGLVGVGTDKRGTFVQRCNVCCGFGDLLCKQCKAVRRCEVQGKELVERTDEYGYKSVIRRHTTAEFQLEADDTFRTFTSLMARYSYLEEPSVYSIEVTGGYQDCSAPNCTALAGRNAVETPQPPTPDSLVKFTDHVRAKVEGKSPLASPDSSVSEEKKFVYCRGKWMTAEEKKALSGGEK